MAMNLADQMLLAQLRESALQSVPDDQWNLVLGEVEKAGGVRQVQGYAKTLLHDAIAKASFGGNRSDAGRYAANVRWQGQDKADRAKIQQEELKESNTAGAKIKTVDKLKKDDIVRVDDKIIVLDSKPTMLIQGKIRINGRELDSGQKINIETDRNKVEIGRIRQSEELKEGNIADELPSAMPPLYNDYGDEPVNPMPPLYNDYGDELGDDERAGARLREAMVPMDLENPQASASKKTPESPSKRIALEVKNASQKKDAAKVVDSARQDAEDAETDLFRAEKDGKSVAEAEKNFAETKALFESAKQAFKERFGSEKMPYQGM